MLSFLLSTLLLYFDLRLVLQSKLSVILFDFKWDFDNYSNSGDSLFSALNELDLFLIWGDSDVNFAV